MKVKRQDLLETLRQLFRKFDNFNMSLNVEGEIIQLRSLDSSAVEVSMENGVFACAKNAEYVSGMCKSLMNEAQTIKITKEEFKDTLQQMFERYEDASIDVNVDGQRIQVTSINAREAVVATKDDTFVTDKDADGIMKICGLKEIEEEVEL